MTNTMLPSAVELERAYDDGAAARHFSFRARGGVHLEAPSPGQFFMLTVPGHGEAAFTYVTAPDADGRFDALIRGVGGLTGALFELEPGALLGVRGPFGTGWPVEALVGKRVLALAGGCGLAPLCSTLEQLGSDPGTSLALGYGSRNEHSQVLARERARFTKGFPVFEIFDQPEQPDHPRGTTLDLLECAVGTLGGPPDRAILCGPEVMMDACAEALLARGLAPEHIWLSLERRMHCGVGLCGHCYVANTYACREGPTYRWDALQALRAHSPERAPLLTELHHC